MSGTSVHALLGRIGWKELAEQKNYLIKILWSDRLTETEQNHLHGILHLIDHIQDEAEKAGFPVVFLYETEEEEETNGS